MVYLTIINGPPVKNKIKHLFWEIHIFTRFNLSIQNPHILDIMRSKVKKWWRLSNPYWDIIFHLPLAAHSKNLVCCRSLHYHTHHLWKDIMAYALWQKGFMKETFEMLNSLNKFLINGCFPVSSDIFNKSKRSLKKYWHSSMFILTPPPP